MVLRRECTAGAAPVALAWCGTEEPKADDGDFIAYDGSLAVGRVYIFRTPDRGVEWRWFAWFPCTPNSGLCRSRREAFVTLEDAFNLWRARTA
ncbi:hypothetical protein FQ775_01205 [Nitratireductor mangrovi]|uniref:Uncharacterized protein n=1 Tax=Nitratireductor mangrovi TaxID=2599600 RepID=A0A5B8KU67_9HYPH|nr:hypothetical protein [Nitratireductor mangrovi]QDY99099.1 hypothetical protein FQ775_01205 [Nitratireductor mangrovi]